MKGIKRALACATLLSGSFAAAAQDCITGEYVVVLADEHTLALRVRVNGGDPDTDPTAKQPLCYPAGANQTEPVRVRARPGSTIPIEDLKVSVRDADPFDEYIIAGNNSQNPRRLRVRITPPPPAGIDLKYDILVKDVGSLDPVVRVRDLSTIKAIRKELEEAYGPPLDPLEGGGEY